MQEMEYGEMTVLEYLDKLYWSQAELARRAGVSTVTVYRVVSGKVVTRAIALKVVEALSEGLGEKVSPDDIDGLNIEPAILKKIPKKRIRRVKKEDGQ